MFTYNFIHITLIIRFYFFKYRKFSLSEGILVSSRKVMWFHSFRNSVPFVSDSAFLSMSPLGTWDEIGTHGTQEACFVKILGAGEWRLPEASDLDSGHLIYDLRWGTIAFLALFPHLKIRWLDLIISKLPLSWYIFLFPVALVTMSESLRFGSQIFTVSS